MRFRVTVRGDQITRQGRRERVELRGYFDGELADLGRFAVDLEPWGLVVASPADDDYDPFGEVE